MQAICQIIGYSALLAPFLIFALLSKDAYVAGFIVVYAVIAVLLTTK